MSEPELMALPSWYSTDFDPYCLEVGRLSALWAQVERNIDQLIWELLDVPASKGICVTAQLIGPGPRVRAMLALIGSTSASSELAKKFQQFANRVLKLGGKRNRYSHDHVTIGIPSRRVSRNEFTADRTLRIVQEPVNLNEIRKLWVSTQRENEAIMMLRFELIEELPAWQRKRFSQSLSSPPPDTPDQD